MKIVSHRAVAVSTGLAASHSMFADFAIQLSTHDFKLHVFRPLCRPLAVQSVLELFVAQMAHCKTLTWFGNLK